MKCKACDLLLTDFESTRRGSNSGDYIDMCNSCLFWILPEIDTKENFELYDPAADDLDTVIQGPSDSATGYPPDADEVDD